MLRWLEIPQKSLVSCICLLDDFCSRAQRMLSTCDAIWSEYAYFQNYLWNKSLTHVLTHFQIVSQLITVLPGFRVLGFRALPGFRAQKNPGDVAWSVHKMLFGFSLFPSSLLLFFKFLLPKACFLPFLLQKIYFALFAAKSLLFGGFGWFLLQKSLLLIGLNFKVTSKHQISFQILDLEFKVL